VINISDPQISKSANPALLLPGEIVTFTITATNPGGVAATNVVVIDPLPAVFIVKTVSTTQGAYTIAGNTITFTIGTLVPGQTVTMTIVAQVSPTVKPPQDVTNIASLNDGRGNQRSASVTVHITSGNLPSTGEHPEGLDGRWWWLVGAVAMFIGMVIVRQRRWAAKS
jgi:uncharacterized repeat protein (TIGR01451 family)